MTGRIAGGELNYPGIGSTGHGPPTGVDCRVTEAYLGHGFPSYRRAVAGILSWQLQRGAGLRVRAESDVVVPGTRVVSGFGVGPLRLNAPCEVVWVREPLAGDVPQSAGFGYGTLPGHPVRGEESFEVSIDDAGKVTLRIMAFGVPSNWFFAAGDVLAQRARRHVTARYVDAARVLAAGTG